MKISNIFYSIQGEGLNMGMPQIFVRFYGCNLRCSWCDTKYAMKGEESEDYKEMSAFQILHEIEQIGVCKNICITGGEPLVQMKALEDLLHLLRQYNYYVHLFTNGSIWEPDIFKLCDFISMDMKPPSSGMQKKCIKAYMEWMRNLDVPFEVKVVIKTQPDLDFALFKIYPQCPTTLIIQPCIEGEDPLEQLAALEQLTDQVMTRNLKNVRVLPQLHKLLWPNVVKGR